MKSLILMIVTMIASVSAYAVNEGPHAAIGKRGSLLAEVSSAGGFRPSTAPRQWGLRLFSDGTVVSFADKEEKYSLTLSSELVSKFAKIAEGFKAVELTDKQEGKPRCMDAPSTSYRIYQGGQDVEIAARVGCHDLEAQSAGILELLHTLEALETLEDLR